MKNLIRRVIKEETNSVDPQKIGILKKFIIDYFSKSNWFRGLDFEIGTFKGYAMNIYYVPEIIITIYVSDVDMMDREIDFSDFMDEIDFIMDVLFPRDEKGRYTAVWVMKVEPV
jgi:hypothetical protein